MAGISIYCNKDFALKLKNIDNTLQMFSRHERIMLKTIDDINIGKEILLKNSEITINSWCRDGLPPDYVKETVEDDETNLILILSDSKENIRGIALLYVDEISMLLHVLCCNALPSVKTRGKIDYGSGGMLIKLIKFLGRDLEEGIKLYALETVITLYYKFGWKFIKNCKGKERKYIPDAVKNLFKYYKDNRFTLGDLETLELTELLTGFRGSAKGRAELIRKGKLTKKEATQSARDDGYEMILCKDNNSYNELFPQEEEKSQGKGDGIKRKKTRRKRMKKKKTKKKKKKALRKRH